MKTNQTVQAPAWREIVSATDDQWEVSLPTRSRLAAAGAGVVGSIPGHGFYRACKRGLIRLGLRPLAGLCDLGRFASGRIAEREIRDFDRVMLIRKGYYDYEYFNICFLNNVLALCLKAVCEGYIPRVEILNSKGENIWDCFFEQPFDAAVTDGKETVVYDEKALEAFPTWSDIYYPRRRAEFAALYARFARLNPKAREYVHGEMESLLGGRRVLGVLCRGTDYTATRPKGHPVQPETEDILGKVRTVIQSSGYEYLYLATEDGQYDRLFREEYGDRLLVNRRNYYDRSFAEQKLTLIKDVHFDRQDDDYLKGLEYISSLQILAACEGLVAGNCGGTQAAILWNNDRYKQAYVYDQGVY